MGVNHRSCRHRVGRRRHHVNTRKPRHRLGTRPERSLQQMSPPCVELLAADAAAARHRDRRYASLQALRCDLTLLLDRPASPPLAARDHLDPRALIRPVVRALSTSARGSTASSSISMDNTHHTIVASRNVRSTLRLRCCAGSARRADGLAYRRGHRGMARSGDWGAWRSTDLFGNSPRDRAHASPGVPPAAASD